MNLPVQHLSDEAVAACADGVLPAGAQVRADRHTLTCPSCSEAVRGQREAMRALRTSVAPALPMDLLDRLRSLPMTTPLTLTPVVLGDGGAPMFPAYGTSVLAAAAPAAEPRASRGRFGSRSLMLAGATTALAVGFVGGAGSAPAQSRPAPPAQRAVFAPPSAPLFGPSAAAITTGGTRVLVRQSPSERPAGPSSPADAASSLPGAR